MSSNTTLKVIMKAFTKVKYTAILLLREQIECYYNMLMNSPLGQLLKPEYQNLQDVDERNASYFILIVMVNYIIMLTPRIKLK